VAGQEGVQLASLGAAKCISSGILHTLDTKD